MQINRKMRKFPAVLLVLILIISLISGYTVQAKDLPSSYTYSFWKDTVPAPVAYEWEKSIRAKDIGVNNIDNITDIFYKNSKVYIATKEQVIIADDNFNLIQTITEFDTPNGTQAINAPSGIFVTDDGDTYITEPDSGVIFQFNNDYEYVRTLEDPQIDSLQGVKYAPNKIVVDEVGRLYVQAKSVYEGIIELDPYGEFTRFVGANKVNPSIADIFWRQIATEEQLARMTLWLPTDYSDIALDQNGFLLATVKDTSSKEPVRRLNSKGIDIMPELDNINRPMGDYVGETSSSILTSIAAAEDGRFAVLDTNNSKVFVYNEDGRLLYMLGGQGKKEGNLNSPVDITFMEDRILVADLVSRSIEVFSPTEYGLLINEAAYTDNTFDYDKAAELWEKVLEINPNFYYANVGIGKAALRNEQFDVAMTSFQNAYEREYYSETFERVREYWLDKYMIYIVLVIILVIAVYTGIKQYFMRRNAKGIYMHGRVVNAAKMLKYQMITYPKTVLARPFKTFDDVKYEGKGSVAFGVFVMFAIGLLSIISYQYTSFLITYTNKENINVFMLFFSTIAPYLIFIVANWAVSVLLCGKGSMSNIFKVNMYALYPTIFLNLAGVILSNFVTNDEKALVTFLFGLSIFIYVLYTFIGLTVVHQYTFTKSVVSIILSIIAMIIIVFVIILLTTLVTNFVNNIYTMFKELIMHI